MHSCEDIMPDLVNVLVVVIVVTMMQVVLVQAVNPVKILVVDSAILLIVIE